MSLSDKIQEIRSKVSKWREERKDRCTLDRIWFDYEMDAIRRYRDKEYKKSELPDNAVPVTGMRNTFAVLTMDCPPPAPYGQNATTLYVWANDLSFERAFEHFSTDGQPIDWKKILIVGACIIVGVYIMFVSGVF